MEGQETEKVIADFFQSTSYYTKLIISKWKRILGVGIFCAVLGFAVSFLFIPYYKAETKFMLDTGDSGVGGGISSYLKVANQLGLLPMSGGMTMDEDLVVDLLSTRKIFTLAMLKKAKVNNKTDLLANHYLEVFKLKEDLEEEDSLKNFKFTHDKPELMTYTEDSIFGLIYEKISKKVAINKQALSGIISVEVKAPSPEFAKYFCEEITNSLVEFYLENKTHKEKLDLEVLQSRTDSISDALTTAQSKYAQWKDAYHGIIKYAGKTEELTLLRNVEILNIMDGEAQKNLELAKFKQIMNSPLIQIIDSPTLPLKKPIQKRLLFKAILLVLGFIAGVIFYLLFIISMDIFQSSREKKILGSSNAT